MFDTIYAHIAGWPLRPRTRIGMVVRMQAAHRTPHTAHRTPHTAPTQSIWFAVVVVVAVSVGFSALAQPIGDLDHDGQFGPTDLAVFSSCMGGPIGVLPETSPCLKASIPKGSLPLDPLANSVVDLADVFALALAHQGPAGCFPSSWAKYLGYRAQTKSAPGQSGEQWDTLTWGMWTKQPTLCTTGATVEPFDSTAMWGSLAPIQAGRGNRATWVQLGYALSRRYPWPPRPLNRQAPTFTTYFEMIGFAAAQQSNEDDISHYFIDYDPDLAPPLSYGLYSLAKADPSPFGTAWVATVHDRNNDFQWGSQHQNSVLGEQDLDWSYASITAEMKSEGADPPGTLTRPTPPATNWGFDPTSVFLVWVREWNDPQSYGLRPLLRENLLPNGSIEFDNPRPGRWGLISTRAQSNGGGETMALWRFVPPN